MSYSFPPEVAQLLERQMASGKYPTEDDALCDALRALSHEDREFEAIKEALIDVDNGEAGVPLDEAFAALRQKYNLCGDG